jgi:hypothetical protein
VQLARSKQFEQFRVLIEVVNYALVYSVSLCANLQFQRVSVQKMFNNLTSYLSGYINAYVYTENIIFSSSVRCRGTTDIF